MKKPTYTYSRQYTRNGNPMQRYEIFEQSDRWANFGNEPHRIAVVFEQRDAEQITELLNSLPNGTKSYNDSLEYYQKHKPEELKEEYRLNGTQ